METMDVAISLRIIKREYLIKLIENFSGYYKIFEQRPNVEFLILREVRYVEFLQLLVDLSNNIEYSAPIDFVKLDGSYARILITTKNRKDFDNVTSSSK